MCEANAFLLKDVLKNRWGFEGLVVSDWASIAEMRVHGYAADDSEAAMKAITSPLLEDVSIDGAKGVLMNVTCGPDLTIDEVSEAATIISEAADEDARIYFGTVFDQDAGDEMRITVIATGIESSVQQVAPPVQDPRLQELLARQGGRAGKVTQFNSGRQTERQAPAPEPANNRRMGGGLDTARGDKDLEVPAFLRAKRRREQAAPQELQTPQRRIKAQAASPVREQQPQTMSVQRTGTSRPGTEDFVFDEDDFEIPSFIRMQAD